MMVGEAVGAPYNLVYFDSFHDWLDNNGMGKEYRMKKYIGNF